MKKPIIRMTRDARSNSHNFDTLRKAATAAVAEHEGNDLHFLTFQHEGKQFSLSSRLIIEVDWFPHRFPLTKVTRGPVRDKKTGKWMAFKEKWH